MSTTLVRCTAFACCAALGCASANAPFESSAPSGVSSPYSASLQAPPSSPHVPSREPVTAGVVVRPDQVCVPFAVRAVDGDADRGVATVRAATDEIVARLRSAAPSGAMRMRGVAVTPVASGSKASGDGEGYAVVVDGAFEVPLPAALDFWARSKLVGSLVAASRREVLARAEAPARVNFEPPQLRVSDIEAFRPRLAKQWVERARSFAEAAQASSSSPLSLVDCAAPGEIAQRDASAEEVLLTLSITCRLDARPPK